MKLLTRQLTSNPDPERTRFTLNSNTTLPNEPRQLPWDADAEFEAERERWTLHPAQSYMRNARLLPPRNEFETLDWYVAVLKLLDRAPATLPMFRFSPTLTQRRRNLDTLLTWEAAERHSRGADIDKRLAGWLDNTFRNVVNDVANAPKGTRNSRLCWGARRLAELGFDKAESERALLAAAAPWDDCDAWLKRTRKTFESGWRNGIDNPLNLSEIEAHLVNRDGWR